jgi:hypothetical protein
MGRKKNQEPKASRPHMPGYGVPKGTKGLLPWSWAKQRLEKSHNYWISTVKPDGSPHTMIVWGLWVDGAFYFSTGRQSRKARNLAENLRCVLCTERADEAVMVEGSARENYSCDTNEGTRGGSTPAGDCLDGACDEGRRGAMPGRGHGRLSFKAHPTSRTRRHSC